jgi:hypothetical protein
MTRPGSYHVSLKDLEESVRVKVENQLEEQALVEVPRPDAHSPEAEGMGMPRMPGAGMY